MITNRSVPDVGVIPVLAYPDAKAAADWICRVLGFSERLRIANHRIQLLGPTGGAVIVTSRDGSPGPGDSIHVRLANATAVFERAVAEGATAVGEPTDQPYGERQGSVVDPWGRRWTLSQSIADADPADWGGELVSPD